MKAVTRTSICLAVCISLPMVAKAEKWVGVFASDRTNSVWYVDTDSISRNGDLALIKKKFNDDAPVMMTFDCARNKLLGVGNQAIAIEPNTAEKAILDKACKR